MPFFAPFLISAALATFTVGVASISLPGGLSASVSSGSEHSASVPAFPQINDIPAVDGQLSSLEGKVKNAADSDARDLKSDVDNAVESIDSMIDSRSTNTPSLAVIFSDLQTQIQPYTDELTFITPSNISVSLIEKSVSAISASVTTAISRLQALSGQNPSVILEPVEGDGQLTVPQVSSIVSDNINMIVGAAANVARAAAGADIDVGGPLAGFGPIISDLLNTLNTLGILKGTGIDRILSNPIVRTLLGLLGVKLNF